MWSELGHSQLADNRVADAIESYLRSGDHSRHADVIQRSKDAGAHEQLVKFLLMVRKKVKDPMVRPSFLTPCPSPTHRDALLSLGLSFLNKAEQ